MNKKMRQWSERMDRAGFFFIAVLLHLILLLAVVRWVVIPQPLSQDTAEFSPTYLTPSSRVNPPPTDKIAPAPPLPGGTESFLNTQVIISSGVTSGLLMNMKIDQNLPSYPVSSPDTLVIGVWK